MRRDLTGTPRTPNAAAPSSPRVFAGHKSPSSKNPRPSLAAGACRSGVVRRHDGEDRPTPSPRRQVDAVVAPAHSATKHPTNEDGLAEVLCNESLAALQAVG
jgi:hypothetical protein